MAINWATPSGLCRLCDWLLLRICKRHGLGKLSFAKVFIAASGSPLKYEHRQNTSKYIKIHQNSQSFLARSLHSLDSEDFDPAGKIFAIPDLRVPSDQIGEVQL